MVVMNNKTLSFLHHHLCYTTDYSIDSYYQTVYYVKAATVTIGVIVHLYVPPWSDVSIKHTFTSAYHESPAYATCILCAWSYLVCWTEIFGSSNNRSFLAYTVLPNLPKLGLPLCVICWKHKIFGKTSFRCISMW